MRTLARSLLIVVVGLGCLNLTGPRVRAFSYYDYGGYVVVWAGNEAVRFMSPSTFPEDSTTDLLYRAAMGLWMMVPSADFAYFYDYFEPSTIDPYDGYSDTVAVDPSMLDPGVLAVTYLVNNGAQWYDTDMLFSADAAGFGWNFDTNPSCEVITDLATHGVSFLMVSEHELGHALGLGHDPIGDEAPGTPWFIGTMNPIYPDGGPVSDTAIVELHADDRNGVRFLYPHSGVADPVVDIANSGYSSAGTFIGKAVPAMFTPETIYPGETLTMTSTIENFGNEHVFNVGQDFFLSPDPNIDGFDIWLGEVRWDLAAGDGYEFEADANLPADLAAGEWWVGSILDYKNEVIEEYEDNNKHTYCQTLTVAQLTPQIDELGQEIALCSEPFVGPTPTVSHPLNMAPLTWSVDNPEPGVWVEPDTGVIHWDSPVRSSFPYTFILRATNDAGSDTVLFFLGVDQGVPALEPIAEQIAPQVQPYTGPRPALVDLPCMQPVLNWSLDAGPAAMEIDHSTGIVTWDRARFSAMPHVITIRATNAIGNGTVTWHLRVPGKLGDLDCDGDCDYFDIEGFLLALQGEAAYWAERPNCDPLQADFDGDGQVGYLDISGFLDELGS